MPNEGHKVRTHAERRRFDRQVEETADKVASSFGTLVEQCAFLKCVAVILQQRHEKKAKEERRN